MPITTEHYMLEAFLDGDAYSAMADKRRFSVVDNQMNIMTEIMGDGRIDGWEIVPLTFPNIRVTQGSGFIDGHYVVTFSDADFELAANGTFFVYAQRRVGISGTVGPRSDIDSVTYTDSGAPAAPASFVADVPTTADAFFNVQLTWAANTEVDFDHYEVERAISPSVAFVLLDSVADGTLSYVDSVDEDTSFTYRLYAVDESGFRSSPATDTHSTELSPILPPDPSEATMPASEGAINVLWKRPITLAFSKVASWYLTWVRLKSDGSEISATEQTKTISRLEFRDRIDNLLNGEAYRVTLRTIDNKGRLSAGVSRDVIPQLLTSPKDPETISVVETELVEGSVVLDFDWTDGADEYDPLVPYAYKIYVTVDGQQESLPISVPIGDSDGRVELFTFNGVNFFSIPQNTLVTFRFTSLSENGIESLGNYVRFITTNFAIPNGVAGLASDFDFESGKITATWVSPTGIADITITVIDDDLGDDYPEITLVSRSIGLIEQFIFDAELNHTYTITVTTLDADGVSGPSNVIVEVTVLSGGFPPPELPREIFPQSGDREISFSWVLSSSFSAASYNIYRKTGVVSVTVADWTLVDNVPKIKPEFVDYGLENDQVYSYYITAIDIYGQESLHLPNGAINLNYFESVPRAAGILTEPDNVQVVLVGDDILVTWESLLEEFDAFTVYRSIGNLHSWESIADLNRNSTSYLDLDLTLADGTVFYYSIGKTINDSDIVAQASNVAPESSILLGSIVLDGSSFSAADISSRRDIKDLVDPLTEYTNTYVLGHRHRGLARLDPERIDLNPELIITDWETVDGRIFTTNEIDISGTGHIVKIDGRFPVVLFEVDQSTSRLIFTEPIVGVDEFGNVIGDLPNIEVRVLGIEEVQGVLNTTRFDNIHARQVSFGRLNKDQMPSIDHEGRIRETLLPKSYLLERFSNHTFIVPQANIDDTKTFGDGTTFYATIESDGLIKEVIDWDQEDDGAVVGFRLPSFASDTVTNLDLSVDLAEVTSDQAFQSEKSYNFKFQFQDTSATRWVRVSSSGAPIKPNPIIDLKKSLRFKILLTSSGGNGSIYLSLGVRELSLTAADTGDDGGTTGPVEWVGVSEVITDINGNQAPLGKLIQGVPGTWQEIEFDLEKESVQPFSSDSNGVLEGTFGVLEHLAFTIVPKSSNAVGPFDIYIDKLQQVDDVLAAGTSQGIQISRDFGTSWEAVRFVETPVHKFYRATNNPFIWALATNTVLISVDPANWFETSGLTGVQYIRDIAEDAFGNMFISTDKGVFWFEIALINNFSSWRQTQPVTAFTTDCYGMYHNSVSSGIDEIWVSTEIGIFKTIDFGATWTDTDMDTQGFPAYEFINISSDPQLPNIVSITKKHVLRKLGSEVDFSILANFEVQHNVFDIWTMEYFSGHLYISTGKGVFWNAIDELFVPGINTSFELVLPGLNVNGQVSVAFGLDSVTIQGGSTQLFIGQENRIMVADELNVLSIKEQFPNTELPSFFAGNDEITIGYVYNAFNDILSFREPQPVNVLYKASNLPRRFYLAVNGGWAQTNPSTDVFVYFNGIPKWLDFKLDESAILSDMQVLQGKLAPMVGTLTDFNSLSPTAANTLTTVLDDINNMIEGGDDASPLVNNDTIIKFLEDYTRFLSLITTAVVSSNELNVFPKFNIAGFPASQRETGSRAATLEAKEDFLANDSTSININTFTGELDFLTAFTTATDAEAKQEFAFEKNDKLNITVFKSNVANTGEFSHRELEDNMESVNTGLSSHMSRAHYTNMIKAGIFMETNHPFLFDVYNASNIQSQYNSAHNSSWYDTLNSTVDYNLVLKVDKGEESRFGNAITLFTENPYLLDRVWVATDNDIMQYQLDTSTGELTVEKSVRPGAGFFPLFVWDIFVLNENDIYVVAEEQSSQVGHIFRTTDSGASWTDLDTINVPQQIYTFTIVNGNKVVGTENGIFFSDNDFGTWFPSNLALSPQLSSASPSIDAFASRIRNIETSTFLIAESDRWFYTSGGGLDWVALAGQMTTNEVTAVNKVHRFKNLTWVGTDKGLYNDGNTVLSDGARFGLQTELEDNIKDSANINVNDISTGADALYCCAGNKIYRFIDDEWKSYTVPDVTSIHKISIRETSGKHFLIIVAHNIIRSIDVTQSSGVFG